MRLSRAAVLGAVTLAGLLIVPALAAQAHGDTAGGQGPTRHAVSRATMASAGDSSTLYAQTNHRADSGIVSQRFGPTYHVDSSRGADDFTVPEGDSWTIDEVDVIGFYALKPPAAAEVVWIYADNGGRPGTVLARVVHQGDSGNGEGSFKISLADTPVTLSSGVYWVSVRATASQGRDPFWVWLTTEDLHGTPAVWRNPLNGWETGCTTFKPMKHCSGGVVGPDFLFALKGTSS